MTVPLPANLRPEEFNILQIVATMAWADGEIASEEREALFSMLSKLFAETEAEAESLYLILQNQAYAPGVLAELVAKLTAAADRELALKLSYMVIRASDSSPSQNPGLSSTTPINPKERAAYRQLVELLKLPEDSLEKVEWAADQELKQQGKLAYAVSARVGEFFGRLR
ncbi:MAG: hypothetical protein ACKO7W_04860 [Elainella sp.]